jgi:phosphoserine phosphatase
LCVIEVTGPFDRILNVIVPDGSGEALAPLVRASVEAHSAAGEIVWLSPGRAFDVPFTGDDGVVRDATRAALSRLPCDVNVLPAARRRKKLLVADMDSTIIDCECLDELADMAGLKSRTARITERAMQGETEFEGALRERVALLKGLPLAALERTWRERVRLSPGAKALVATMRSHGARALLVSGGFTYFTGHVAAEAGFDDHRGNALGDDGAALTGTVAEPILGRAGKRQALEREAAQWNIDLADSLAVGDGANDLDMVAHAGLGVAYHAKPVLANAAAARIDHGDLTSLLYLQGYGDDEIVSPA